MGLHLVLKWRKMLNKLDALGNNLIKWELILIVKYFIRDIFNLMKILKM